jgi:hypothetical protein
MSKQIICIKARSHSNFELYLIGEKYDIPYDFLVDYKKDKEVYKFWTEVGSGIISAFEERPTEKDRNFVALVPLTDREKNSLLAITPLRTGEVINKYKGDIEEKEQEFKALMVEIEKKKQEMLNRKYDPSNIVCINAKSSPEQIFSVCVSHDVDFTEVMFFLESNPSANINRVWFEKETSALVAYNYIYTIASSFMSNQEKFEVNPSCLIPKPAINRMSKNPVPTPKLKVNQKSLNEYIKANDEGFLINIPKFERVLESGIDIKEEPVSIDLDMFDVEELKSLLQTAVEDEDYESAAVLRDAINEIESKNKKK